jgi:hypothetical protein
MITQGIENLAVEKLVAKLRVEAFAIAVFPRAVLSPDGADPVLHHFGDEFGAVVRTNMLGNASHNEQL